MALSCNTHVGLGPSALRPYSLSQETQRQGHAPHGKSRSSKGNLPTSITGASFCQTTESHQKKENACTEALFASLGPAEGQFCRRSRKRGSSQKCVRSRMFVTTSNSKVAVKAGEGPFPGRYEVLEGEESSGEEDVFLRKEEKMEKKDGHAWETVVSFYGAINRRDLEGALTFVADDCVYEDLIYSAPFRGKEAIRGHFKRVLDAIPDDLVFVIDDISKGDPNATGMIWHAEIEGRPFPFSRGCSFYRCSTSPLDSARKISFARDIPEPASKPGDLALAILRLASLIFRRIPK